MLQELGITATPIRITILDCFRAAEAPMSADGIVGEVRPKHPTLNRTTVYRELARFVEAGLVEEVLLASRARVYELAGHHHHHAICKRCDGITHVEIPESLGATERLLQDKHGFTVERHSLEFYGLCAPCSQEAV